MNSRGGAAHSVRSSQLLCRSSFPNIIKSKTKANTPLWRNVMILVFLSLVLLLLSFRVEYPDVSFHNSSLPFLLQSFFRQMFLSNHVLAEICPLKNKSNSSTKVFFILFLCVCFCFCVIGPQKSLTLKQVNLNSNKYFFLVGIYGFSRKLDSEPIAK